MTFNEEFELQYLEQIKEYVKRGWLEMRSGGIFGDPYVHCRNCDACISVICTDSPGDRLDSSDPKQTVNCPNCSAPLGKFLSATRPVTLLATKEEYENYKAVVIDWSEFYEPSDYTPLKRTQPKTTQANTNTSFEFEDDIPSEDDIPF